MASKEGKRVRWRNAATAVMVALTLAADAHSLNAEPGTLSAPTSSEPSTKLLERWNEIGRKLIAIAEDLPEAKYAYKPHADARSFVDQLLHAAGAMASFTDRVVGRAERYPCDPTGSTVHSRSEVVELVRRSVSEGDEILRAAGEGGLNRVVDDGSAHGTRLADLADALIEHSGEHYGQLVVYYRINGMVPPESR